MPTMREAWEKGEGIFKPKKPKKPKKKKKKKKMAVGRFREEELLHDPLAARAVARMRARERG